VCKANGIERAPETVDWFFKGERITISSLQWKTRVEIVESWFPKERSYVSELTIHRSTVGDQGVYLCRSSDLDIASMTVHVSNGKWNYNACLPKY
jgi:hypothetical protein